MPSVITTTPDVSIDNPSLQKCIYIFDNSLNI